MAGRQARRKHQGKQCPIRGCVNTRREGDTLESGGFVPTRPTGKRNGVQSERRTIPHQRTLTCGKPCHVRGCVNTRWKETEEEFGGLIQPRLEQSSNNALSKRKAIPHARRPGCGKPCGIRKCVNTRWKETEDEFEGSLEKKAIPHARSPDCGKPCGIRKCVNTRWKETEDEFEGSLEKKAIPHARSPDCGKPCRIHGCVNTRWKEAEVEFGGTLEKNVIPHAQSLDCGKRTKAARPGRASHRGGPGNRRGRGRGHGRGRGRGSSFGQGNGLDVLDSLESSFGSGSLSFD